MTTVQRLEQKVESEKPVYSLDKYSEFGLLKVYADFDSMSLRDDLKNKYKLKDIGIKNFFSGEHNFFSIPGEIEVTENDLKFIVTPKNDNEGFATDQKLARELIQEYSKNKDVLDLFANYGTYSIYCATGANSVTSVESEASSFENLNSNIKLNTYKLISIPQVWNQSYEEFIDIAIETRTKYDIIILDLSVYNLSKLKEFDLNRDHKDLIRNLQWKLLKPSGFIFLMSDVQDFVLDQYIRPGADKLTKKTISEEFLPLRPHQSFAFYN